MDLWSLISQTPLVSYMHGFANVLLTTSQARTALSFWAFLRMLVTFSHASASADAHFFSSGSCSVMAVQEYEIYSTCNMYNILYACAILTESGWLKMDVTRSWLVQDRINDVLSVKVHQHTHEYTWGSFKFEPDVLGNGSVVDTC